MKKRVFWLIAALCLIIASVAGCKDARQETKPSETADTKTEAPSETESETEQAAEEPETIGVADAIGRALTIAPGTYRRVVCIGAGALRVYSYIGDVTLLVGVEDIDNESLTERPKMFDAVARPYVLAYGETFKTLPSCGTGGPNAQSAEAEKILACEPDIVISEYEDVEKENALQEQLGVPVITLRTGKDGVFDDAFKGSLRLLGTVFQKSERAEELITFIEKETDEITSRAKNADNADKKNVYICGLGNWGTTNHLMTAQNYVTFNVANVKNVVNDLPNDGIQPIESEKFIALGGSIDVMIIDAAAVKNIQPLFEEDPAMFDSVKAWNDGEVYLEMAYNAYYTNFETALLNTWFTAKAVYPDLFSDIDMKEKTDEVTKAFLGKPLSDAIYACPQSFDGYQKIDTEAFFQ